MKKIGVAFLSAVIMLSLLLVACNKSSSTDTDASDDGKSSSTEAEATTKADDKETSKSDGGGSGSGGDFHGIPLPEGAKQAQSFSWQAPVGLGEGEYGKVEWRGYEIDWDAATIADFFQDEMPGRGWEQMFWIEEMGIYFKDNEEQAAWVFVSSGEEEEFDFLLMWAGE